MRYTRITKSFMDQLTIMSMFMNSNFYTIIYMNVYSYKMYILVRRCLGDCYI